MSLFKKIIVGMGAFLLANTPIINAAEIQGTKEPYIIHNTNSIPRVSQQICKPHLNPPKPVDTFAGVLLLALGIPTYIDSPTFRSIVHLFPLYDALRHTCTIRINFGVLAAIAPLWNTYRLYTLDKKLETVRTALGRPVNKNEKYFNLLFGASVIGSIPLSIYKKTPFPLKCLSIPYAFGGSLFHGILTGESYLDLEFAERNLKREKDPLFNSRGRSMEWLPMPGNDF